MPSLVNEGMYDVVKYAIGGNSIYDVLFCKACNKTVTRCNFSRHKKSGKHTLTIKDYFNKTSETKI